MLWVCKDVFLKQKLTLVVGYNSNCECGREILVRTKILSSFKRDSKGSPGTRLLGGRSLGQMG